MSENCNIIFGIYEQNYNPIIKPKIPPRESDNLKKENFVPLSEKCCKELKDQLGDYYYKKCLEKLVYRINW